VPDEVWEEAVREDEVREEAVCEDEAPGMVVSGCWPRERARAAAISRARKGSLFSSSLSMLDASGSSLGWARKVYEVGKTTHLQASRASPFL
jgi:hypothetical protein